VTTLVQAFRMDYSPESSAYSPPWRPACRTRQGLGVGFSVSFQSPQNLLKAHLPDEAGDSEKGEYWNFRSHQNTWTGSQNPPNFTQEGQSSKQSTTSSSLCPNASCLCPNDSCLCPNASCLCPNDSCLCPNDSCLCPNASCLCPNVSCLCPIDARLCPNDSCLCPIDRGLYALDMDQWTISRTRSTLPARLPASNIHQPVRKEQYGDTQVDRSICGDYPPPLVQASRLSADKAGLDLQSSPTKNVSTVIDMII
jgi:hypothetical protein